MGYFLKDKTVLITGGTGSFGQAMAKKLLQENLCAKVVIFSRDEWKQWEMQHSDPIFDHPNIRYFLGDVRDTQRLARAFREVHVVIHAAALKQVPAAEYNPSEFIKTNILGAMNVIDNAIERGVERVIALSTDKAVNPVNLYGATKLCSDKLFVAGNAYVGARGHPLFSAVRYGNVIGSRGSIVPLWKKMLEEGASFLSITDERMTRFWITLEQSVLFVLQCLEKMQGSEIFIPKIPSVNICDLADAVAPHLPKKISGIREGEKLHELLISSEESRYAFELDAYYVLLPPVHKRDLEERKKRLPSGAKPVLEEFIYASNTNTEWLNSHDLKELIS